MLGTSGGINQTGGLVAAVHIGGYVSGHSIVGMAGYYDKTLYDAGEGDSFRVVQWLGNIHYRYALPVGRFVLLPTGGVLLGAEKSDSETQNGNLVLFGSKFIYGVALAFDVEYVLGRHWTLALQPRLSYLINSNFDKIKVSAGIGVKYYF